MNTPHHITEEDTARSNLYGLLATLYYAPPPLDTINHLRLMAHEECLLTGTLAPLWQNLLIAAKTKTDNDIAQEYHRLFGGVGKPDICLFASHYLSGFLNEKPVVILRNHLAALGLMRAHNMSETEDHFSYLCEVMRYLIGSTNEKSPHDLSQQIEFFFQHIKPWFQHLCADICAHPNAQFYAALAQFTQAFLEIESQGFDMCDASNPAIN